MPQQGSFEPPDFGDVGYMGKVGGTRTPYSPVGPGPGGGSAGAGYFGLRATIPDFGFAGGGGLRRRLFDIPNMLQMRGQPTGMGQGGGFGMGTEGAGGLGFKGAPGPLPQPNANFQGNQPGSAWWQDPDIWSRIFPEGQFSGNRLQQYLMNMGMGGGAFDPYGSEGLLQSIRGDLQSQHQRDLPALIQRARTQAGLDSGNDPLLKAYAGTMAGIGAQNQYSSSLMDALAGARQQSGMQNQSFLQQILSNYFGGAVNRKDPKQQGLGVGIGYKGFGANF